MQKAVAGGATAADLSALAVALSDDAAVAWEREAAAAAGEAESVADAVRALCDDADARSRAQREACDAQIAALRDQLDEDQASRLARVQVRAGGRSS